MQNTRLVIGFGKMLALLVLRVFYWLAVALSFANFSGFLHQSY